MSSISLRAYHRQIEEWIDQGLYDQAIVHCRHILNHFPKSLNTYRLLGKAFLESQKFGDANDIFQRVLSSIPDDFVSHVGMSIIREDESNLNEAIWHMERAFEIQPSNNAIQGELKRLYGRRDGIEPPKVNLNRSALARMYLKGNLHSQAIAEIRMALAEDLQRPDLEVLLARAYYETQQYNEAREVAAGLLAKLPYCYDAIFILWQIALKEGKIKDAERQLAKLAELDPYAAFLNENTPSVELVSDTSVLVEKLEASFQAGIPTPSQEPDWAASLGVQITSADEKPEEAQLPEWMAEPPQLDVEAIQTSQESALDFFAEPAEVSDEMTKADEIPEWMREIGWEESKTEEAQPEEFVSTSPFTDQTDLAELQTAEIPDWLKEISPSDEVELTFPESTVVETLPFLEETPPTEGDSIATWLAGLETEEETSPKPSPAQLEDVPDWVDELTNKSNVTAEVVSPEAEWSNLEPITPPAGESPIPSSQARIFSIEEELPAWLIEEEPQPAAEPLPDWLLADIEEEPPVTEEDTKPVAVTPKQELSTEQQPLSETSVPSMEEEAFAWLESLAAKQGAEEALLLSPEERKEEPPEWIREYLESKTDTIEEETVVHPLEEISPLAEPISEQEPEWFSDKLEIATTPPDQSEAEALPDWLRIELEKDQLAETPVIPPEEIEVPEWVISTREEEQGWIPEYLPEQTEEKEQTEPYAGEAFALESELEEKISEPFILQQTTPDTSEFSEAVVEVLPVPDIAEAPAAALQERIEPISERETTFTIDDARLALTNGDLDQALGKYQTLISQKFALDQIIQDLSNALYQYPMDVRMWMLLGDAYLRKDLLSEALDAYNKAEELLR